MNTDEDTPEPDVYWPRRARLLGLRKTLYQAASLGQKPRSGDSQ